MGAAVMQGISCGREWVALAVAVVVLVVVVVVPVVAVVVGDGGWCWILVACRWMLLDVGG